MSALYVGFQGSVNWPPGSNDHVGPSRSACASKPGPSMPPSEPAMTRMIASPFSFVSSAPTGLRCPGNGGWSSCRLRRQVHPQLDAVEEAAVSDQRVGRSLDVQDARAGGHPLGRRRSG